MNGGVIAIRLSKIVMAGGLAFWAFLVTLGNVTDYGSNWAFVQHVMSMDTVFPDSALKWRAITDPAIQTAAYGAIIIVEGLTCLAFLAAAVRMAVKLRAPKAEFQRAKAGYRGRRRCSVSGSGSSVSWASAGSGSRCGSPAIGMARTPRSEFSMTVLAVAIYVFLDTDGEPGTTSGV